MGCRQLALDFGHQSALGARGIGLGRARVLAPGPQALDARDHLGH